MDCLFIVYFAVQKHFSLIPIHISCRVGLMAINFISFCLSWKILLSPSLLKKLCQIQDSLLTFSFFSFFSSAFKIYQLTIFWPDYLPTVLLRIPCVWWFASFLFKILCAYDRRLLVWISLKFILPIWSPLNLLRCVYIHVFDQIWEVFDHFFK